MKLSTCRAILVGGFSAFACGSVFASALYINTGRKGFFLASCILMLGTLVIFGMWLGTGKE
jgi:hypothetical protein